MRKCSLFQQCTNDWNVDELISEWNPLSWNPLRNFGQHFFLPGHRRNAGESEVFPSNLSIHELTGCGKALPISWYSQGNNAQPSLTHALVIRDSETPTWLNGCSNFHPDVWTLKASHTEFPWFWSHLCSQLPHPIISANLLSLQTTPPTETQPLGHEIKAYLSLVNYFRTTNPQAFFVES